MKQLAILNPEQVNEEEAASYTIREAARAVVFDSEKHVALLYVVTSHHYILPGGGIKEGEEKREALRRECREEIGCEIEIVGEIGSVTEWRKIFGLQQISYCYAAVVTGEKGEPKFTKKEEGKGFELHWLPYEEALKRLSENQASTLQGRDYIVPRDLILLTEAKAYVLK
jgi:8-oxo-dGTP diphosphatase